MTKTKEIAWILDHFDFCQVHDVMMMVGWEWGLDVGIPTIQELRQCAEKLLSQIGPSKRGYQEVSTGGLRASYIVGEKGHGYRELQFILCETDGEYARQK